MAEVEVKGLNELLSNLKKLPQAINQKCLRRSLVPGAQKIRDAAKTNLAGVVREKTGLLKNAIRLAYNRKESTPGKAVYHVFVSMNVRKVGEKYAMGYRSTKKLMAKTNQTASGTAFYWRFIEFYKKGRGATPFMRPAFDSNVGATIDLIKNKLAELIEKEASSLGR